MMRTGPGRNYPGTWLYQRRDLPVRVLKIYPDWRLIEDPDGTKGWMLVTLLSDRRTAIVKPGAPRAIRATPGMAADVRYLAQPGVVGRIDNCRNCYCRIEIGTQARIYRDSRYLGRERGRSGRLSRPLPGPRPWVACLWHCAKGRSRVGRDDGNEAIAQPATPFRRSAEYFGRPRRLPFSDAVRVGDTLYLSGQLGLVDGKVPDNFEVEAKAVMDNIGAILKARGPDPRRPRQMHGDARRHGRLARLQQSLHSLFQPAGMPARSAFGADGLALGAQVEVECWAYAGRNSAGTVRRHSTDSGFELDPLRYAEHADRALVDGECDRTPPDFKAPRHRPADLAVISHCASLKQPSRRPCEQRRL